MALPLFGGAALGAAFETLFGEVKILIEKAAMFKGKLKKIERKLVALDQPIKKLSDMVNEKLKKLSITHCHIDTFP
ncbi:hypothetical protein TIFTF001_050344 [Ficus carica]|uniref:Uncharacterized protein n=1 Tax=Ficus carica TaxID=3494 RepID=A0AA88D210_FICCA|nr:hypothetical protein TIFTF001_050344 [Ficus carica]